MILLAHNFICTPIYSESLQNAQENLPQSISNGTVQSITAISVIQGSGIEFRLSDSSEVFYRRQQYVSAANQELNRMVVDFDNLSTVLSDREGELLNLKYRLSGGDRDGLGVRLVVEGSREDLDRLKLEQAADRLYLLLPISSTTDFIASSKVAGDLAAQPTVLNLTVDDVVQLSLANNPNARIAGRQVDVARLNAQVVWGIFAPTVGNEFFYRNTTDPVASVIFSGSGGELRTESFSNNSFVRGRLLTGGEYSFDLKNSRNLTNNNFQLLVPEYITSLGVSITQPLLRNLWIDSSRRDLKVAQINKQLSKYTFARQVQDLVFKSEQAHLNLILAQQRTNIANQALNLATEQYVNVSNGVSIGRSPAIDAVSAEAELFARKGELAAAQDDLYKSQNELRALLAKDSLDAIWNTPIHAIGDLNAEIKVSSVNLDQEFNDALADNMELAELGETLKLQSIERSFLFNQGFPQLDLKFEYSIQGLAGDSRAIDLSFGGSNARPLSRFQGGFLDNVRNAFTNDFNTVQLGAVFSWPVSPGTAKRKLRVKDLEYTNTLARAEIVKINLKAALLNAYNAMRQTAQRVEFERLAVVDAKRQLEGESQKFKLGLSTNFLVLTRQNDLFRAELKAATALVDHLKATSEFRLARGRILQDRGVQLLP